MATNPIIVLWTTPRSRSTAFERMMIERGDHLVMDEPFSARYYFSNERRSDRFDMEEPGSTGARVMADIRAAATEQPVFVKDMAYHATGLLSPDFLAEFTNTFLVREPMAAISSLARKWPDFTSEEAGYEPLGRAYELVRDAHGSPPPVIDGDELATDPPGIIAAWCDAVGIPFMADALTWEPGVVEEWVRWQDWYEGVADSTGFRPPIPSRADSQAPVGGDIQPAVEEAVSAALPVFEKLTRSRLRGSA